VKIKVFSVGNNQDYGEGNCKTNTENYLTLTKHEVILCKNKLLVIIREISVGILYPI